MGALVVGADALFLEMPEIAARAEIHTRYEHERGGVLGGIFGATDADDAVLQRLPHYFEHRAQELWQFVHEKHAVMRQRDFARGGETPATT